MILRMFIGVECYKVTKTIIYHLLTNKEGKLEKIDEKIESGSAI